MKRAALLTVIVIILVAGFLYTEGFFPAVPPGYSVLESIIETMYQDTATITLLILAVVLFAFLIYSRDISRVFGHQQSPGEALSDVDTSRVDVNLARRFESTERALQEFADAMEAYAEHLVTHTSAIQGLSEASHALKGSASEQNRILGHLTESIIHDRKNREISIIEKLVDRFEERTSEALLARDVLVRGANEYIIDEIPLKKNVKSPPGCVVKPGALGSKPN